MNNCNNCAWFCHSDGKCYGCGVEDAYIARYVNSPKNIKCSKWTFDGLEDWEREGE